jgi:hypothetical protein
MADLYPPVRQRTALLSFAEALGSASTALRRDDNGDWRIKGKLGFIYAVQGLLHQPAREGFQLYCDRRTKQAWTWAKKLLCFCGVTQDGDTEGPLFLDRLSTSAEAETIRDVLGVAKRPVYDEEVMAQKRERGRQICERSAQNRPRPKKPQPWSIPIQRSEFPRRKPSATPSQINPSGGPSTTSRSRRRPTVNRPASTTSKAGAGHEMPQSTTEAPFAQMYCAFFESVARSTFR